jgi:hypothetical protein
MSGKLIKYRLYCTTDNRWEFVWKEETEPAPTTCPTNTTHTINSSSVSIVDERAELKVQIQEESVETGGHFRLDNYYFTCPGNTTTYYDFSIPINISVLSYKLVVQSNMADDQFGGVVSPDTTIGVITANVGPTDKIINVSSTVVQNAYIGMECNLFDGTNTDVLGFISDIDTQNNQITVQNSPVSSYLATTPTQVRIGIKMANDVKIPKFTNGGYMEVGSSKIGASHLPANTVTRVKYINNSSDTKECHVLYEYLY